MKKVNYLVNLKITNGLAADKIARDIGEYVLECSKRMDRITDE